MATTTKTNNGNATLTTLPSGWKAIPLPAGKVFYQNMNTGDFAWELGEIPQGKTHTPKVRTVFREQKKVPRKTREESSPNTTRPKKVPHHSENNSTGSGAVYRNGERSLLFRKFNEGPKTVVIMDSPSYAGIQNDDLTTKRLNKILRYNGFGSYYLINVAVEGWEQDLEEVSRLSDKVIVAWGAIRRDRKDTKESRKMIQEHFPNIYQFEARGRENMPTRLKHKTNVILLDW